MMRYLMIICFLCFLGISCEESPEVELDPSNLVVEIVESDDIEGKVTIIATAQNATEFHFYMNDGVGDAVVNETGTYSHIYASTGLYTIEVRAYGFSGKYISKQKEIFIQSADPEVIGEGYSTPFSYAGMNLVWNDEFNGSVLNEDDWSYDIGDGCDISPDLCGWGNEELEYYRKENCWVSNGLLHIEARKEEFGGRSYTSSRIKTQNNQGFQYGRIDVRAKMAKGQGIWPAIWMLGTNISNVGWPQCGEIDIVEMIGGNGRENYISGNAYWYDNGTQNQPNGYTLNEGLFSDKFYVYTVIWNEVGIKWFVNDIMYHSIETTADSMSAFHKNFYFLINLAVGGNWPGSPNATTEFPVQLQVDYLRVFQKS